MCFEQLFLFDSLEDSYAPDIQINASAVKKSKKKKYKQLEFQFDAPAEILSDNEYVLHYQAKYRTGDNNALSKIYYKVQEISYKMIVKEVNSQGFYLCGEDKLIKSYNIASYVCEQLFKRPDFRIKEIGGYIHRRMLHELYYKTKVDDLFKNIKKVNAKRYLEIESDY